MELLAFILDVTVDILIIIFFLLMIILALISIGFVGKLNKYADNLADFKFWFNMIKGIPSSMRKSKKKTKE